jgi:hypothetical protein
LAALFFEFELELKLGPDDDDEFWPMVFDAAAGDDDWFFVVVVDCCCCCCCKCWYIGLSENRFSTPPPPPPPPPTPWWYDVDVEGVLWVLLLLFSELLLSLVRIDDELSVDVAIFMILICESIIKLMQTNKGC